MTDESLQAFLNLSDREWAAFLPQITPEKRALYERMASVVVDLNMGIVPEGVIACHPKNCRHK